MTVNLDNTKALNRIADALEAINTTIRVKGGLEALTAGLALMSIRPGALGGEAEHFVFLVHTVAGLCGDKSEGRIGSFVHPGVSKDDTPWIILVGRGPVMCEHATETARKVPAKFKEAYDQIEEEDNDD